MTTRQFHIHILKRCFWTRTIQDMSQMVSPLEWHPRPLPPNLKKVNQHIPVRYLMPTKPLNLLPLAAGLDPGERTFQTLYDVNGRVIEFGPNFDPKELSKEELYITHKNIAQYLYENYYIIFLPKYSNRLSHWNHEQFYELVKSAHPLSCRIKTTENLTSQICSNCGTRNKVGSRKTYKCKECQLEIDRDTNAARNILYKSLDQYHLKLNPKT